VACWPKRVVCNQERSPKACFGVGVIVHFEHRLKSVTLLMAFLEHSAEERTTLQVFRIEKKS